MIQDNRGAQLLRDAGSLTATAEVLGVATRTVSGWRSGRKVPSEASRSQLERLLHVPRRSWDEHAAPQAEALPRPPRPAHWRVPQDCPWLTFGHPLATLTVRHLHAVELGDDAACEVLGAELAALEVRHPELVRACREAEQALGTALASARPNDLHARAFLRWARAA